MYYKKPAVIMVHTFGLVSDAQKIRDYCKSKNLYLVEDSAEAHGQSINEEPCGSFGDLSTLVFMQINI